MLLADSVESFKTECTHSANINLLKVSIIFLGSFAASASVKIDVNQLFEVYL
jgi:hypothetical protein